MIPNFENQGRLVDLYSRSCDLFLKWHDDETFIFNTVVGASGTTSSVSLDSSCVGHIEFYLFALFPEIAVVCRIYAKLLAVMYYYNKNGV